MKPFKNKHWKLDELSNSSSFNESLLWKNKISLIEWHNLSKEEVNKIIGRKIKEHHSPFVNGFSYVSKLENNKQVSGFIDRDGNEYLMGHYYLIGDFTRENGLRSFIKKNNKTGLFITGWLTPELKELFPDVYKTSDPFDKSYAGVETHDNNFGFITEEGYYYNKNIFNKWFRDPEPKHWINFTELKKIIDTNDNHNHEIILSGLAKDWITHKYIIDWLVNVWMEKESLKKSYIEEYIKEVSRIKPELSASELFKVFSYLTQNL